MNYIAEILLMALRIIGAGVVLGYFAYCIHYGWSRIKIVNEFNVHFRNKKD